ncbi:MAG: SCO family protein [Flavobacteriales bacterium]|nr:SCO family protein [Flavobacteriales bacterium]
MSTQARPADKRTQRIVLGILLGIVPAGLLFFKLFENHYTTLPHYGQHEVNAPGDTTYFQVPEWSFTDQDGNTVSSESTKDRILVVDFFFTTCKSICPIMSTRMAGLQVNIPLHDEAYKDVLFLSYTVDPEHDTREVLKEYARQHKADSARWKFLTGDAASIYRLGNTGYLISVLEDTTPPSFIPEEFRDPNEAKADSAYAERFVHSPNFVLVDKQRHIRGVYDGTTSTGTKDLVNDIKLLIGEERKRKREGEK